MARERDRSARAAVSVTPGAGVAAKYDGLARNWSASYATPGVFFRRRARFVCELGPALEPGDRVLEVGCADGALAQELLDLGLVVEAVDISGEMVARARQRVGGRAVVGVADFLEYRPSRPVAATIGFRVLRYVPELTRFFARLAEFTERKLVFDLVPSTGPALADVERSLRAGGFDEIVVHPWLLPARTALPAPARPLVTALERVGPLAQAVVRRRFSVIIAAWRS